MTVGIKLKSLKVQIRTITLKFVTVGQVIYWFIAIAIDLFRLLITDHVTIPRSVLFFPKLGIFMLARSLLDEHDKGSNLLGIVTSSVFGKKSTCEISVMNMSDLKMYLYLIYRNKVASLLKYLGIAPLKLFSNNESIVATM